MEKDEKLEVEKNCCENMDNHSCVTKKSCCKMKNCCALKIVLFIIIILVVFCLGSFWGRMKYNMGYDGYRGGMMNWNYDRFEGKRDFDKAGRVTGDVKVEVSDITPSVIQ